MALTGVEVLREAYQRAYAAVKTEIEGLTPEQLVWRPQPDANCIAFIAWHIARVGDVFFSQRLLHQPEVWFSGGWEARTGLQVGGAGLRGLGMGTGFSDEQAGDMPKLPAADYQAYLDAVAKTIDGFFEGLDADALDRTYTAENWPDAKLLPILFQVLNHAHTHRGEIGYIKGLQGIRGRA